jgi:cyclophilin family peptidyl-prolyl cis-trans isomerase
MSSNRRSRPPPRRRQEQTRDYKKLVILPIVVIVALAGIYYWSTLKKKGDTVVLETSLGSIEIQLYKDKAPKTVDNFVKYVNNGFYDGTVFHRIVPGFVIQGGGFTPDGTHKTTRAPIPLESDNGLSNEKGTLAMARTNDPDSATSQFFINLVDNEFLDYTRQNPGYAVFGKVTKGMDVVEEIASVTTTTKGTYPNWPVEDVVITKAYIK